MKKPNTAVPVKAALPSEASISKISALLVRQFLKTERRQKYAPVKEVLALLGRGAVISAALLAPKSAPALLTFVRESSDWDDWKRFNVSYLRRTLRRLELTKHVEVTEENGMQIIQLSENGKRKILKYSLDNLTVDKPQRWDGRWRLVLYDIPVHEKHLGDLIRETIRAIGFYAIQDSVYLFPYPCFEQIEFLREYYHLGDKIQYMLIEKIERDQVYKTYFNLS